MIADIIFWTAVLTCLYLMFRMAQYDAGERVIKFPSSIATKNSNKINNRKIHAAANKIKKMIKKSSKDGDKSIHLDYNFFTFNSCGWFAEDIAKVLKEEGYDVVINRHAISVNMTVKWK